MIKFHLEKMSSLLITYVFENYMSLITMMPPRQKARRRVGLKTEKEA
jgi:hypothetical protein